MGNDLDDRIQRIVDNFEWNHVVKVMDALDWKWVNDSGGKERPPLQTIQREARRLLYAVASSDETTPSEGTGGLIAQRHASGSLGLAFQVTWWDE